MEVRSPHPTRNRNTSTIAERAQAILDDEIAGGALANIVTAAQVWSAHRRDAVLPEVMRRLEFGGLLDTVLDLLAPLPRSAAGRSLLPSAQRDLPHREERPVEPVPVLRARRPVRPGGTAEIRTTLQNDDPTLADVGFLWSDLVGEPGGRIRAARLRLLPGRVRVPPGASADLTISLDVPDDASPGLYHVLLQAPERARLCALLTFPVGFDVVQEAPVAI